MLPEHALAERELSPATVAVIRRSGRIYNLDDAEADALAQTLRALHEAKVGLQVTLRPGMRPKFRSARGDVTIRTGVPSEARREFRFGLFRFKVSPIIAKRPFAVFAVCKPGAHTPMAVYCFKSREICELRSLNLRFERFSPDDSGRVHGDSKYEFARNRWDVLG